MSNANRQKEKQFIHRPEYPGGKTALLKYINDHLQYPKDAMEQINQPLFPSCDEEALRLVRSLQYGRPKNWHLRVKSSFSINIKFRLKEAARQVTIQYSQAEKPKPTTPSTTHETYTYTINY